MPRTRPLYSPEFRRQMIELVRGGRTPEELSREFEPSAQAIRNWVRQSGGLLESQREAGLTSTEQEELRRLRRRTPNAGGAAPSGGRVSPKRGRSIPRRDELNVSIVD